MKYLRLVLLSCVFLSPSASAMLGGTFGWGAFETQYGDDEAVQVLRLSAQDVQTLTTVPARQMHLSNGRPPRASRKSRLPVPIQRGDRGSSSTSTQPVSSAHTPEAETSNLSHSAFLRGSVDVVRDTLKTLAVERGGEIEKLHLTIPQAKPHIVSAVFQELPQFYGLQDLHLSCVEAPPETVWNMMRQAGVLAVRADLTPRETKEAMRLGLSDDDLTQVGAAWQFYTTAPAAEEKSAPKPLQLYAPVLNLRAPKPFEWHETRLMSVPELKIFAPLLDVDLIGQVQSYLRDLTVYKWGRGRDSRYPV